MAEAGARVGWRRRTAAMGCDDGDVWLAFRFAPLPSFCCANEFQQHASWAVALLLLLLFR
jgi:hypothetical protein